VLAGGVAAVLLLGAATALVVASKTPKANTVTRVVSEPTGESAATLTAAEQAEREHEEREQQRNSSPQGAVEAVKQHWDDIASGNLGGAYETCTAASCEAEPVWLSNERREHIESVTDRRFELVPGGNASEATVRVASLRTVARESGCKTWTGTYTMIKEAGAWRISEVHLTPGAC